MSLIKQLWLTIVALLILAFVGSLFVSISSSRHYIEQEIRIKNSDNANALALSMSQLEKDPVILELLLAAQFDTGHYRRIELRDPEGEVIERRVGDEAIDNVPSWFVNLVRFDVPPGRAVVQDGWRQYGTLILESHHSFAYQALWRSTLALAGWFAVAAAISLLLAAWIVRTIRRPLRNVVSQAQAIGEQRFVDSPEPRTRELRELVKAMNRLAANVSAMLSRESEKLDLLRRRLQHDPVTDTLARAPFLDRLEASLASDSHDASGTLGMIRVANLSEVNQQLGHQKTDAMLVDLAQRLKQLSLMNGDGRVGRLNGSDFAVLIPRAHDLKRVGEELTERLQGLASEFDTPLTLPSALTEYTQGKSREALLSNLDGALATAENQGDIGQVIVESPDQEALFTRHEEWRHALESALQQGVHLAHFPVLDTQGKLLHYETPARLRLKGEWRPAGVFLPWISRLEMSTEMDLAAVAAALDDTAMSGKPIGINLSPRSLRDGRFVSELLARLRAHPEAASRLWLELPEAVAIHNPTGFSSLCREVQALGCRMGLEHATSQFAQIEGLQHLGLSYLKTDASLSKEIEHHQAHQSLLRGMSTLAHSLGITVIAEGVESRTAAHTLFELGLDGVTGPGVRQNGSERID